MPGRTAAFNQGQTGGGPVASSLDEKSAVLNEQVAGDMARPHSVLAGLPGMSGNGGDEVYKASLLPGGGTLGTSNGASPESFQAAQIHRMYGSNIV